MAQDEAASVAPADAPVAMPQAASEGAVPVAAGEPAQQTAPVAPPPPAPAGPTIAHVVVGADGGLTLEGAPTDVAGIRTYIRDHQAWGEDWKWDVLLEQGSNEDTQGELTTLFVTFGVASYSFRQPIAAVVAASAGGAPAGWIRPIGEFRFNFDMDRLDKLTPNSTPEGDAANCIAGDDGEELETAFSVPRAAFGFEAEVGERIDTKALINAVESRGSSSTVFTTAAGDTGEVSIAKYADGWSLRVRDLYADYDVLGDGKLRVRAGVHSPLFGTRDFFDSALSAKGYYLIGPDYEELAVVAGMLPSRDLGVVATAKFGPGATLDLGIRNGPGTKKAEDNNNKDVYVRLLYPFADDMARLGVSADKGMVGDGGNFTMVHGFAEVKKGDFKILAGGLGGNTEATGESTDFVGAEAAAAWLPSLGAGALDRGGFTARWGVFDPLYVADQAEDERDALSWMVYNFSGQLWWKSHDGLAYMTGVGYRVYVPMNCTQEVEHAASLQSTWKF